MRRSATILIRTLFIVYLLMVLFFCFYKFSSPSIDLGKYFLGIRLDRYAHFIMFFPYPFISWLTCKYTFGSTVLKKYALAFTIASGLAFAAVTEICQDLFFLSRQGDVLDFAADSAAILAGAVIVHFTGNRLIKLIVKISPNN